MYILMRDIMEIMNFKKRERNRGKVEEQKKEKEKEVVMEKRGKSTSNTLDG